MTAGDKLLPARLVRTERCRSLVFNPHRVFSPSQTPAVRFTSISRWRRPLIGFPPLGAYLQAPGGRALPSVCTDWTWAWAPPPGQTSWAPAAARPKCWRCPERAWSPSWLQPVRSGHCPGSTWFWQKHKTGVVVSWTVHSRSHCQTQVNDCIAQTLGVLRCRLAKLPLNALLTCSESCIRSFRQVVKKLEGEQKQQKSKLDEAERFWCFNTLKPTTFVFVSKACSFVSNLTLT